MWRRNILQKKREEVRASLTEKLFILDGVFGPVLAHHRNVCKDLEQYRLVNLNQGIGVNRSGGSDSLSLAEFSVM